jgi:hypothetical protein
VLESYEGLLLVRPAVDHNRTAIGAVLDLYLPVSQEIWDAVSPLQWQALITSAGDLGACLTKDIMQALDDVAHGVQLIRMDVFQSSLLIAVQGCSLLSQVQGGSPYEAFTHSVFAPEGLPLFENSLALNPYVRFMYEATQMSVYTPLKALLSTSGESWLLSQKLSNEARTAKEAFEALKRDLRVWTDALHQPLPALYPTTSAGAMPNTGPVSAMDVPARRSLGHAVRILSLALDVSPNLPSFGPELVIYYAALILWACTYSSLYSAAEPDARHIAPSSRSSISSLSATESSAEIMPEAAGPAGRHFIELAESHLAASELAGTAIPAVDVLDSWKLGVSAILKWTAWTENGGMNGAGAGVGELISGAVAVLERLQKVGWVEGWF